MKLSCSSSLLYAAGADTIEKMVTLAAEIGYSGIQIECGEDNLVSAEKFSFKKSAELVRFADKLEIEFQCLNISSFPTSFKSELSQIELFKFKKYISIANSLACPLVSFTTPTLDKSQDFNKQYEKIIRIIQDVSEFADEFDICMAIKPSAKTLTENIDESIDLADDSGSKNIGIVYCPEIYASLKKEKSENPEDVLKMVKGYLLQVQMDNISRNYKTIKKIVGSGFEQFLCDCSSNSSKDIIKDLKNNVSFLKEILSEPIEKPKEITDNFLKISEKEPKKPKKTGEIPKNKI